MDFPTFISRTSPPISILGMLFGIFHLFLNLNRTYCKLTVKIQMMRRLIWVCTICLCPIEKILGLDGLSNSYTMGCPHVRGVNPRALASRLSCVQVDKRGITILYHLHQYRPCTS